MAERFALRNYIRKINFDQFKKLTGEFVEGVEEHFGTIVYMEINFLTEIKFDNSYYSSIEEYENLDKERIFATYSNLNDVKESDWDKAAHVIINIKPIDVTQAAPYSFARLQFKGTKSRQMTAYVFPKHSMLCHSMRQKNRMMVEASGSNGEYD